MKVNGFIRIKQGNYHSYNTSTWIETGIGGILDCLKIITPELYETIITQKYDEDGYLDLKDIVYELFPTDEVFKSVILKDFVENKYFEAEAKDVDLDDDKYVEFKLSKENRRRNIGVFVICRFKTTMGVENNCDNIGTKFSLNKIYCYYDPTVQKLNNTTILKASEVIKDKFQNFLNEYHLKNPHLDSFEVAVSNQ